MQHPNQTPIEDWPDGWLNLEVASILDVPIYLMMHTSERVKAKFPSTREEQIAFIKEHRNAKSSQTPV